MPKGRRRTGGGARRGGREAVGGWRGDSGQGWPSRRGEDRSLAGSSRLPRDTHKMFKKEIPPKEWNSMCRKP